MGTDKTDSLKPKPRASLLSVLVVKSVVKILQEFLTANHANERERKMKIFNEKLTKVGAGGSPDPLFRRMAVRMGGARKGYFIRFTFCDFCAFCG